MVKKGFTQKCKNVNIIKINPKAVNSNGLYGYINALTNEWHDGIVAKFVRFASEESTKDN